MSDEEKGFIIILEREQVDRIPIGLNCLFMFIEERNFLCRF